MITHLSKLALTIVGDPIAQVDISNVSEGVSESSSFIYETETEKITIEDSQELHYAKIHTITAVGLKNDQMDEATLEKYNDPDAKAMVAAIGPEMSLISLDPVKVEVLDHFDTGPFWKIKITKKTVPHRESVDGRKGGGLFVGRNILSTHSWNSTDVGLPATAAGWEIEGTVVDSRFEFELPSTRQVIELSANNDGTFIPEDQIYYPFQNEGFGGVGTFRVDVAGSFEDWGIIIGLKAYDESGAESTVFSKNISSGTDSFFFSLSGSGSSRELYLKPYIRWVNGTVDTTIFVSNPTLIAGGDEVDPEFTNY